MPGIEKEFKDKIIFEYRDISQLENYKMLLGLLQLNSEKVKFQVPLFYLGGRFLTAQGQLRDNLRSFITAGIESNVALGSNTVNLMCFVPLDMPICFPWRIMRKPDFSKAVTARWDEISVKSIRRLLRLRKVGPALPR